MLDQNRQMRELERKYGRYLHQQANKRARSPHEKQDLYQIGLIALWKAHKRYVKGPATFLTYASWSIKGDMGREAAKYRRWETPTDTQQFDVHDK